MLHALGGLGEMIVGLCTGDLGLAFNGLKEIWTGLEEMCQAVVLAIANQFAYLWERVKGIVIDNFPGAAKTIREAWEPVGTFFTNLWNGVVAGFSWAWAKIQPLAAAIADAASWLNWSDTKPPALPAVPAAPAPAVPTLPSVPVPSTQTPSVQTPTVPTPPSPAVPPSPPSPAAPVLPKAAPPKATPRAEAPDGAARPQTVEVQGRIAIHVTSDGQAAVTGAETNHPGLDLGADPGHAFAGAF